MACETSTNKEDWRRLKDNFSDAAASLDVKKVTYYVWFHITFHFVGIKGSAKACNTKSSIAPKCVILTKRGRLHDSAKAYGFLGFWLHINII